MCRLAGWGAGVSAFAICVPFCMLQKKRARANRPLVLDDLPDAPRHPYKKGALLGRGRLARLAEHLVSTEF